jgi:hypothetical protein
MSTKNGNTPEPKPGEQKSPCTLFGHNYHALNYSFARDADGKAFRGGTEWHAAAKFAILVCGKCGDSIEREIGPALDDRTQIRNVPDKKAKAAGA